MIEITREDDVTRLRMWTRLTRAAGYDVSAWLLRGILVDTGFRHVAPELMRAVAELRPRGVVVTHWHEDHAGNAPVLAARGVPLWMPADTERILRARPRLKPYRHVLWGRPLPLDTPLVAADVAPLQVIPTPGHSADHHVVHDPGTDTVVSGDLWLGVRVRVAGADEDPYAIIASLDRIIALRPRRLLDAHRGAVEAPVAALEAKRDWLRETVMNIERRLRAGDSDRAVVRDLLGGEEASAFYTQGEYARRNLVRSVRRHMPGAARIP